jgi:hypothetical protein
MALAEKKSKSKGLSRQMARSRSRFAVCVHGTGFDLLEQKAYRIIEDDEAGRLGCLRVIDESGEDYLYPAAWFVCVRPEKDAERRLTRALSHTKNLP